MRLASLQLLIIWKVSLLSGCGAVTFVTSQVTAHPPLHKNFNETSIKNGVKPKDKEMICVDGVCHIRGGSLSEDEYDDEYDDEEELPPPQRRPSRSRAPSRPHSRRRQPPSRRGPQPGRGGPPPRRGPPTQYHGRRSRKPSLLNSAAGLAKKTVGLTTSAAVTTVKGSGKAAFYLVSPKHVSRREVWGVWRLDQQVITDTDTPISCAANVEFTPRGEVVVKYKDEIYETTYIFRERSWPQSCSIEFQARAFQGPHDEEPVLMKFKGSFRRKMADSRVIKIVGNIYEVPQKGLWRKSRTGRKVGTFVARRRLTKREAREEEFIEDECDEEDELFEDANGDDYDKEKIYSEEDEYDA